MDAVEGNGVDGFSGDGGPATAASLYNPWGIALDGAGNLFIVDASNFRIRRVTPDGRIDTVAGTGVYGFSGDGGTALEAQLGYPQGIAAGSDGTLSIADNHNDRVRCVRPKGLKKTPAGI